MEPGKTPEVKPNSKKSRSVNSVKGTQSAHSGALEVASENILRKSKRKTKHHKTAKEVSVKNVLATDADKHPEEDLNLLNALLSNVPSRTSTAEEESERIDQEAVRIMFAEIAEDFWETAWELCSTRFCYTNASDLVVSELRDAWLTIAGMQWLDTDASIFEPIVIPASIDKPPFPPNYDSWAHGALDILPDKRRESIMDPFLREPFPWFLDKLSGNNNQLLMRKRICPIGSSASTTACENMNLEKEEESIDGQDSETYSQLVRPSSPVSLSSNSEDESWSTATTAGRSFVDTLDESAHMPRFSSLTDAAGTNVATAFRKEKGNKIPETRSIEILYPTNLPVAEIKASSEFEYKMRKDGDLGRTSQIITFKLPGQTSSQAAKARDAWISRNVEQTADSQGVAAKLSVSETAQNFNLECNEEKDPTFSIASKLSAELVPVMPRDEEEKNNE